MRMNPSSSKPGPRQFLAVPPSPTVAPPVKYNAATSGSAAQGEAPTAAPEPADRGTPPTAPPPPRLLDRVREAIRVRHYSIRTEDTDVDRTRHFILFHDKCRLPVVLTPSDVRSLLREMNGTMGLVASLLYGAGMRLLEGLRLRVKDFGLERRELLVRDGKGGKDRVTVPPENLVLPLQQQMARAHARHARDLDTGGGATPPPERSLGASCPGQRRGRSRLDPRRSAGVPRQVPRGVTFRRHGARASPYHPAPCPPRRPL